MSALERRILSAGDRQRLRQAIADKERALEGHIVIPKVNGVSEGMSARRQGRWESFIDRNVREDGNLLKSQIRKLKSVLDAGSPVDLSRKDRRMLEKQAEEDRQFLKRNMVSRKLYHAPSVFHHGERSVPNPDYARAAKAVEMEYQNRELQRRADRYKNAMRQLDPDNPDASNIETLRKNR